MVKLGPHITAAVCNGRQAGLDYDALQRAAAVGAPWHFDRQTRTAAERVDCTLRRRLEAWLERVASTIRVAHTLQAVSRRSGDVFRDPGGEAVPYGLLLNQLCEHRAQGVFFLACAGANAVWLQDVVDTFAAQHSTAAGVDEGVPPPVSPLLASSDAGGALREGRRCKWSTRRTAGRSPEPTALACRPQLSKSVTMRRERKRSALSSSASLLTPRRPMRAEVVVSTGSPGRDLRRSRSTSGAVGMIGGVAASVAESIDAHDMSAWGPEVVEQYIGSPLSDVAASVAEMSFLSVGSGSLHCGVYDAADAKRLVADMSSLGLLTTAPYIVAAALAEIDTWNTVVYATYKARQGQSSSCHPSVVLRQGMRFRADPLMDACMGLAMQHRSRLPPGFVSCVYAAAAGLPPPPSARPAHPDWATLASITGLVKPQAQPPPNKVHVPAWLLPKKARSRAKRNARSRVPCDKDQLIAQYSLPSDLVDAYDVSSEVLGRGTYAVVRLARRREEGGAHVAVKTIVGAWATRLLAQRAYRETNIMQQLVHPCILPVLDVFSAPCSPHLHVVLPLLPSSLADLVAAGVLTPGERRWCVMQILSGVAYMHRRGVIHRDLKLSNILASCPVRERDARGRAPDATAVRVYISDFGLARSTGGEPPDGMLHPGPSYIQSLWYRAPEVLLSGFLSDEDAPASPPGFHLDRTHSPSAVSSVSLLSAPSSPVKNRAQPTRSCQHGHAPPPPTFEINHPPFQLTITHPATPRKSSTISAGANHTPGSRCASMTTAVDVLSGPSHTASVPCASAGSPCTSIHTVASDAPRCDVSSGLMLPQTDIAVPRQADADAHPHVEFVMPCAEDVCCDRASEAIDSLSKSSAGSAGSSDDGNAHPGLRLLVSVSEATAPPATLQRLLGTLSVNPIPAKSCLRQQREPDVPRVRSCGDARPANSVRPAPLTPLPRENSSLSNLGLNGAVCGNEGLSIAPTLDTTTPRSLVRSVAEAATDTACDMWSVGCIVYEVVSSIPLFPGQDEQHQRELLQAAGGDGSGLRARNICQVLKALEGVSGVRLGRLGVALVEGMCRRHPELRLTAEEGLDIAKMWVEEDSAYEGRPAVDDVMRKGCPYVGEGAVVLDLPCSVLRDIADYREHIWGRREHRYHQRQTYVAIQTHSAATSIQRFWRARRGHRPTTPTSSTCTSRVRSSQPPSPRWGTDAGRDAWMPRLQSSQLSASSAERRQRMRSPLMSVRRPKRPRDRSGTPSVRSWDGSQANLEAACVCVVQ